MSFPPLQLIKRLDKGSKITPAEEDQNMTDIETAVNAFFNELAVALNPNGTLKAGSVSTSAIQDRAVTLQKLAFLSSFYAEDTGGANAIAISFTPGLTAYVAGLVFFVKAAATNTGATTVNVNLVGNQNAKVYSGIVLSDLSPGQVVAGNIYLFVHDGVQFLLLNPSAPALVTGPVFIAPVPVYVGGAIVFTAFDASASIPAGAKAAIVQVQSHWASAVDGECDVSVRPDNTWPSYLVGRSGGTDSVANAMQAQIPITTARTFEYRVTETVPAAGDVAIDLIGYVI
jgi:hypothetical protein